MHFLGFARAGKNDPTTWTRLTDCPPVTGFPFAHVKVNRIMAPCCGWFQDRSLRWFPQPNPTLCPSVILRLLSPKEATEKPPTPTCWGVYPLACHVTLYPGAKRGQVCTCVVTHVCVCSCRKLLIPAKWGHFRWSSQLQMTAWDFRIAIEDQFKVELKSELQSGFFFCDSWVAVDQGEGWGAFALQRLDVCILNVKSSFRKTPSINPFVSSLIN